MTVQSAIRTPERRAADQKRLCEALDKVVAALAFQKQAVAEYRETLAELDSSVGRLGRSMHNYRRELKAVDMDIHSVHREARRLISIMDGRDDEAVRIAA